MTNNYQRYKKSTNKQTNDNKMQSLLSNTSHVRMTLQTTIVNIKVFVLYCMQFVYVLVAYTNKKVRYACQWDKRPNDMDLMYTLYT